MKKSELRKLVSEYNNLKRLSKKHDFSSKIKELEHRYEHETGRKIQEKLDGKGLHDLYRHTTKLKK